MAGAVKRGLQALQEMRNNKPTGSKGSGIWKLWLKEDERADFWFMNNGDDVLIPQIHLLKIAATAGRKEWTKDVACTRDEDNDYCQLCEENVQGPYPRLVTLVYVTDIRHAKQNAKKDGPQWEPKTVGGRAVYIEHVNDYRLVIAKNKLEGQILDAYQGVNLDEDEEGREPTLIDRPYQLVKSGSGGAALEVLTSGKPRAMPEAVAEAYAKAPDLAVVVEAEFSDNRSNRASTRTNSGSAAGYDPDRIPTDADLENDAELEDF